MPPKKKKKRPWLRGHILTTREGFVLNGKNVIVEYKKTREPRSSPEDRQLVENNITR